VFARLTAITAITDLVGSSPKRVFPRQRPQGTNGRAPCIVFRVISEQDVYSNDGATGAVESRVEVQCIGATSDEADSLAKQVAKPSKDGGPLSGFSGTAGGVTIQHAFIDGGADDLEPLPGGADGDPVATLDFMIMWER